MKTISIDFDGVIHKYSKGYGDGKIYDPPVPGANEFLTKHFKAGNPQFILSTRNPDDIVTWMSEQFPHLVFVRVPDLTVFWNRKNVIGVTNRKLAAHIYIDDRGFKFEGYFPDIDKFETYQEREKRRKVCPNKDANGVCPLHNIHCNYPKCEIEEL